MDQRAKETITVDLEVHEGDHSAEHRQIAEHEEPDGGGQAQQGQLSIIFCPLVPAFECDWLRFCAGFNVSHSLQSFPSSCIVDLHKKHFNDVVIIIVFFRLLGKSKKVTSQYTKETY